MNPEYSHCPLRNEEAGQIEAARNWVKGHFSSDEDQKYVPLEGKLRVVATILESNWVASHETWKLQALGVTLGDAIAQKLILDWVSVHDEYGWDPALHWPGTAIFAFPLTMISKRVEKGEAIEVTRLFELVCANLSDLAYSGRST